MQIHPDKQAEYEEYEAKNSSDAYSARVVSYGKDWAELMEKEINEGRAASVDQCAHSTSLIADTDGITGFMYGCAVSALAHFWIHGEALRRWHNLKTQIRNEGEKANEEGGILNPALVTIG